MKRSWIGLGLLGVLLVAGLLVTWAMVRFHDPIAADLTAAGEQALAGNWVQAEALSQKAADCWEKYEFLKQAFVFLKVFLQLHGWLFLSPFPLL